MFISTTTAATSSTKAFWAVGVIAALLVVWAVMFFVVSRGRRPKTPLPANLTPYADDDRLETSILEKALSWCVFGLVVLALLMGYYFVTEPNRQAESYERYEKQSVERGAKVFGPTVDSTTKHTIPGAFDCQKCHGVKGIGGSSAYTITDAKTGKQQQVTWLCPSLNDVLYRFSEDELRTILVYGRPSTPMPAWGIKGGGPMNDQQIEDTIAYLKSIQVTPEQALKVNAGATDAKALFEKNCARCHTIGAGYNKPEGAGSGGYGPALVGTDLEKQFPKAADHVAFVQNGSEWQKPYGVRGLGTGRMPAFGQFLTPDQVKAVVAYERSLQKTAAPEATAQQAGQQSGQSQTGQ